MRVVRVGRGSAEHQALLSDRERLEAFARAGLLEPSFDLAHELERPFSAALAAFAHAGERAPCAGLLFSARAADELTILSVVVDPAFRRRGVARALVSRLLADAAAEGGLRVALLEVRRQNGAAIRLYRGLGFVAVRLRRAYYEHPPDDAVEMAAEIEPGALAAFGAPLALDPEV